MPTKVSVYRFSRDLDSLELIFILLEYHIFRNFFSKKKLPIAIDIISAAAVSTLIDHDGNDRFKKFFRN